MKILNFLLRYFETEYGLTKQKTIFFSYIRKSRREVAKSSMTNGLLIYD
jgi:hypothetical protein